MKPIDWIGNATFIAKHAPGFGNPLDMPIDLFAEIVRSLSDMMMAESGADTGRSAVEREMRRLLGADDT